MNTMHKIDKIFSVKDCFNKLRLRDEVMMFEDDDRTYWKALRFQAINLKIKKKHKEQVLKLINEKEKNWYKATNMRKSYNIL